MQLLFELLSQFDCDWTSTFTTSYILQCAVILINNLVLIISNLVSFIVSKANSSSFFNAEKVTLMPTVPPSLALFPSKFSFQRLFALKLFQNFAVLWILCILSPSFLKWDCSWDHLPVLHLMLPLKLHRMVIVSLPILKKKLEKGERGEKRDGEGKEKKEECRIWLSIIQNNGN